MALDDFTSDDSSSSSSISTRKKVENVKMTERAWNELIASDPGFTVLAAHEVDETSAKAIVKQMDKVLDEGIEGTKLTDEQKEDIQHFRDEIVEDLTE